jgi:hypothetical protein
MIDAISVGIDRRRGVTFVCVRNILDFMRNSTIVSAPIV